MEKPDMHDGLPPLLNVDTLAKGALYELLSEALSNVAKNINDPNTSEKAKRGIKIGIDITPYHDRTGFTYAVAVETKLAGMKPAEGTAYIARRGGEYLVVGKNQNQLEMELAATESERRETHTRPQ